MFEVILQFEDEAEYFLLRCRIENARALYKRGTEKDNAAVMGLAAGWIDVCLDDLQRTIAPDTPVPPESETAKP